MSGNVAPRQERYAACGAPTDPAFGAACGRSLVGSSTLGRTQRRGSHGGVAESIGAADGSGTARCSADGNGVVPSGGGVHGAWVRLRRRTDGLVSASRQLARSKRRTSAPRIPPGVGPCPYGSRTGATTTSVTPSARWPTRTSAASAERFAMAMSVARTRRRGPREDHRLLPGNRAARLSCRVDVPLVEILVPAVRATASARDSTSA